MLKFDFFSRNISKKIPENTSKKIQKENIAEQNIEKGEKKIKDIASLSEKNKQELKDAISKSNGLIRLFVHPYWVDPSKMDQIQSIEIPNTNIDIYNDVKILQTKFEEIITKPSLNMPPIFVMERYNNLAWFKKTLEDKTQHPIYLVPTSNISVEPIDFLGNQTQKNFWNSLTQFGEDAFQLPPAIPTNNIQGFAEYLKNLGVTKALIGGMNLDIPKSKKSNSYILQCVGDVVKYLKQLGIECEVSLLVAPQQLRQSFIERNVKNNNSTT